MNTIRTQVKGALTGVCACVIYGYPTDMAGIPRVCWRESENRRYAQADGIEHLTELNYTVDIFAAAEEGADGIADLCDSALTDIGLRREGLRRGYDEYGAHLTLRYRALADADGNIYQ